MNRRVVVTGMSCISPIGNDWQSISANLKSQTTGITYMPDWEGIDGLLTKLAAPAEFTCPYPRKKTRPMGKVAQMGVYATEVALKDAGLLDDPDIKDGRMGVAYGSSSGSPDAIGDFGKMLLNNVSSGINATSYIRMMQHTATVNIGVFFGLKGRIYTTCSACTSSSQGIGYAYEAIKYGHQTMMVAGGGEELSPIQAAVFDTLFATSTKNQTPDKTPRPFDQDRDGLVIGEGAGTLILEELSHAQARGATIYAEICGYGTNSDGTHVTQPQFATMGRAMELALEDAGIPGSEIGYVSAHGTATDRGDIAESKATLSAVGRVPVSSMKSFTGHTLGACGAIEAETTIRMMNEGWGHVTANLDNPDPECADLDYIMGEERAIDAEYYMSNNFAFGGINTSLVFRKWA